MCFSDESYGVFVTCSQEKRDKGNHLVEGLYNCVFIGGKNLLDIK